MFSEIIFTNCIEHHFNIIPTAFINNTALYHNLFQDSMLLWLTHYHNLFFSYSTFNRHGLWIGGRDVVEAIAERGKLLMNKIE